MSGLCKRAVQHLRKLSLSSRGMVAAVKPSQPKQPPESANKHEASWVSGREAEAKKAGIDEKSRAKQAEKAEKIMHLVCWGPHII